MQRENIMCGEALLQIEILYQNVKNRASYPPTIEILASQRREAVEEESQGRPPLKFVPFVSWGSEDDLEVLSPR